MRSGAIDTYYMKFLKFHVISDLYFGHNIPATIEETDKYYKTHILSLGSDVFGIMNVLFDRRARNQLRNLRCLCRVYPENTDESVSGIFTKTEHDELRIHTDKEDYHVMVNNQTLEVSGITGEYRNYRTVRVEVEDSIGQFFIGCMVISSLRCRCYDSDIRERIYKLTDFARVIVDDPDRFYEVQNFEPFYSEI
jgi:hypothetical protein